MFSNCNWHILNLRELARFLEGRGFEIYESVFLDKEDFVQHLSKRKFVDFMDVEFRRHRHNFFKLGTFLSSAIVSNLLGGNFAFEIHVKLDFNY